MRHIYIIALLGLCSCTQMRYNIAKRHLDKIGLEICDTVTIHDTTVVTESRTDTLLRINEISHDTVIIREGQSEVKYFYNTHDSTIYIEGKCHDTLIIEEREGQAKVVCDKCKARGEELVLQYVIKQESSKKVDNLKTSSLISLTVALKSSLIVALFID